jgi:hypothetical protein
MWETLTTVTATVVTVTVMCCGSGLWGHLMPGPTVVMEVTVVTVVVLIAVTMRE